MAHGERHELLEYRSFVKNHEDNLYFVLQHLEFLSKYPLCFAEVCDEEEQLPPGTIQTINLCRGAARSFVQLAVTPSHPIVPGVPFIWESTFSAILYLSPFFIYGLAASDTGSKEERSKARIRVSLQGLMVLNSASGKENYVSLDEEVHISLDALEYPSRKDVQRQLDHVLERGLSQLIRIETSIEDDEKEQFSRHPGDVPKGYVFKGEKDSYTVERDPVGRGGMGVVYLVTRESDGVYCALKAMPQELMAVGSLVRRFKREARVLLDLSEEGSRNIVRFLDFGSDGPYYFLVMEYVPGGSLADELWSRSGKKPPFTFGEAFEVIRQVCQGISVIHEKGMIHRDIKPSNILFESILDKEGQIESVQAKIVDFGLARRIGEQSVALTMELGALGTFQYMPPEQFEDLGTLIDERADIYAIAKVLVEMLTGTVPRNASEIEVLDFGRISGDEGMHEEAELLRGESVDGTSIKGVRYVLSCALARNPEDRFRTIADFIHALRKASNIDEAAQIMIAEGVTDSEVCAAFGLAKIGHHGARERLLLWCSDQNNTKHAEASIAIGELDNGIDELISKAEQASTEKKLNIEESLVHSLSCVLQHAERTSPRTFGQVWLRKLSSSLCKKVQRVFFLNNLSQFKHNLLIYAMWYAGLAIIPGVVTGTLLSIFKASVFWQTTTNGVPVWSKVVWTIAPWTMAPFFFAGLGSIVCHFGSLFSRPKRFLAIIGTGIPYCLFLGSLFWIWAISIFDPAPGRFVNENEVLSQFQHFLFWMGILAGAGFCSAFLLKQFPFIHRKHQSLFLSVTMFAGLIGLSVLPISIKYINPFYFVETLSMVVSITACGFGAGVADWSVNQRILKGGFGKTRKNSSRKESYGSDH